MKTLIASALLALLLTASALVTSASPQSEPTACLPTPFSNADQM